MRKAFILAKRNFKELIRDPLSIVFCIALPLILLFLFQQFNIPSESYNIENFTPAIAIFSFGFISLFSGTLVASDRNSSFLTRLFTGPLSSYHFIFGYLLAFLPIAFLQSVIFYICAIFLGLSFNINIIISIFVLTLISILFITIGLLLGIVFKQSTVPGIGSLLVNISAFASGMWFSIDSLGKFLEIIFRCLPFCYALDISKFALKGDFENMIFPSIIVIIYTIILFIISITLFKNKMAKL